jgi:hypothetical protein
VWAGIACRVEGRNVGRAPLMPIIRSGRINYIFEPLYEFYGATVEIDESVEGSWGYKVSEYAVALS